MKNRLFVLLLILAGPLMAQVGTVQEGFEDWPPNNWQEYLLGAVNQGWLQDFESISHTGDHSAHANINNDQCDHWLVTPPIQVNSPNYNLKFWEYHRDATYYDKASVWISTGSGDPVDGDFVEWFETPQPITEETWEERIIDLSGLDQEVIYIAFRYEGTWHRWYLDDVTVGPDSFTDLGIDQVLSPTGVSPDPGLEPVEILVSNNGDTAINELEVNWWVNGDQQTAFSTTALGLEAGGSMSISLGDFDFDLPGLYELEFEATATNDFDASNNQISGTYTISQPSDMAIMDVFPQGNHPVAGMHDVSIRVRNAGQSVISDAIVLWEVDGNVKPDVSLTALGLQPGEELVVELGDYDFDPGLHQILVTVQALGDINPENDQLQSPLAVQNFFESFEGSQFPPTNWDVVFGIKETGFTVTTDGDYYYVAQPDTNVFGTVYDTITSPRLLINPGDTYTFNVKPSAFLAASHSVIAIDPVTGEETLIENINPVPEQWNEIVVDLSSVVGLKRIAVTSTVIDFPGLSQFDEFSSTAQLHLYDHDLSVVEGNLPFMANLGISQNYVCRIKNEGANSVAGADYTVRLMADGNVIAQVNGVDLASWEESQIVIPHTFMELGMNRLYFEVDFQDDEFTNNNQYRPRDVYVLPADAILDEMAPKDIVTLAFPFNGNGNSNTLGEEDLTQSLYRQEAFDNNGTIHGMVYHYDNLLEGDYVQHLPLQLWGAQTSDPSLNNGFYPASEMVLLFDGVVEILPGDGHELYIPFEEPIAFTGLENLVIQNYQFDPEWPPAIMRFYRSLNPEGDTRSLVILDAFEIDPQDPGSFYATLPDFPYVHFVVSPETDTSDIAGTVIDQDGTPLENVVVTVDGTSLMAQTAVDGSYQLPALPYGSYVFRAELFGYDTEQQAVDVQAPQTTVDFVLNEKALLEISGRVVGSNDPNTPLVDVAIAMDGYVTAATSSAADGSFMFQDVYGNEAYSLTFSVYGYAPLTLEVTLGEDPLDLGDVVLDQQFISAYQVTAVLDENVLVSWEDPQQGSIDKVQGDLDVISNSYTNEPFEEVWLGNLFEIDQPTTIASVEIRTEVFELALDFLSVDVIDLSSGETLASSEPFLMPAGETFEVDLPNILVDQDVLVAIHWQDNPESTNALAIDYSNPSVENIAMIKYPGMPAELFNQFTGNTGQNMAFLVRMNVLQDGPPNPNAIAVGYNVYRGLASEFPSISNWELLTESPITETNYEDVDWWTQTIGGELYRFAVETVYPEGVAEPTFSNSLLSGSLGIGQNEPLSTIALYPNPAVEVIHLSASGAETLSDLRIYDLSGKLVYRQHEVPALGCSVQVGHLASGMYLVQLLVNDEDVVKKVVIGH